MLIAYAQLPLQGVLHNKPTFTQSGIMVEQKIFKPPEWSKTTNIYEVNIRQYSPEGTFNAFAKHLPRLKKMGVETLWMMPITPISQKIIQGTLGSYYACSCYVKINQEFGTLDDFKSLVDKAHTLGMKVMIDWVANHTGWDHEWTLSNPEYFVKDDKGYFTQRDGWHDVIDLDYTNTALRVAMAEAMAFWVRTCHIDGFRCDLAHLVPLDFWKKARQYLDKIKPLYWLAETDNPECHAVFDVSYAWEWMHESTKMIKEAKVVSVMDKVLYRYHDDYSQGAQKLFFTTNHDENSWNGTEYEKYNGAALPLAVFTLTWDGIPLIYSGQEIPNLRRLAFFEKDQLNWKSTLQLEPFYRTLLGLRKSNPALKAGSKTGLTYRLNCSCEFVFAFLRREGARQVLVVLNLSPESIQLHLHDHRVHGVFQEVFEEKAYDFAQSRKLDLKAWGWLVMEQ